MTRTFARDAPDDIAAASQQFAAAASPRSKTNGLAFFIVAGRRLPRDPAAGSIRRQTRRRPHQIAPGAVVSVQATIDTPSGPILIGAPVLVGRNGERASLLVAPLFSD